MRLNKLMIRKEVAIFKIQDLPKDIYKQIMGREQICNDIYFEYVSDLSPYGDKDWSDTLSMDSIEKYWKHQCDRKDIGAYKESLDQYIIDCGLLFDRWLIDSKFDLKGIKLILIECSW